MTDNSAAAELNRAATAGGGALMAKSREAKVCKGFYYQVESRLRWENWSTAERITFLVMLQLATEGNRTGGLKARTIDIADAIAAFDFHGKAPTIRAIDDAIAALAARQHIRILPGNWYFINDFWGYSHNANNPDHLKGAEPLLANMPPEVSLAFRERWGSCPPSSAPSTRTGRGGGSPPTTGAHKEYEQEQEQEELFGADAPRPAAAPPASSKPAGRKRSTGKPKAEITAEQREPYLPMAQQVTKYTETARTRGFAVQAWNDEAIAGSMVRSGEHPDKFKAALAWGARDRYWSKELLNHPSFANGAKWRKLINDAVGVPAATEAAGRNGANPRHAQTVERPHGTVEL